MKSAMRPLPSQSAMGGWTRFFLILLVAATPTLLLAHNSIEDMEEQIDTRERFAELTDLVAPVFTLQDVDANTVRLDDFRGRVVILNFLYSRCEEQCPLHSAKLAEVQQQLSLASLSDRVQFITIATDTEDAASTTESMRAHGPRYQLDAANWMFLQGGKGLEDLGLRLAAAYGLKFVPTGDGEQMHGVVTFLIGPEGKIRAKYHGLRFNSVNLTVHAAKLASDHHNSENEIPVNSALALTGGRAIIGLAAFASLAILACIAFIFYWNRRRSRGLPPVKTPDSPSQGKIQ